MVRAFIAVDIDKIALPNGFWMYLKPLEQQGIRIIPPENYHVTLYFLGEIDQGMVDTLRAELGRIIHSSFTLQLGRFETFPRLTKRSNRYVLHLNVVRGKEALIALHGKVLEVLTDIGFPKERRPFIPHLTLARIKYPKPSIIETLKDLMKIDETEISFPEITITSFQLKRSNLTPRGAIYENLAVFPLQA